MYFEKILPFLTEYGYFERNRTEKVNVSDVFCPLTSSKSLEDFEKDAVVRDYVLTRKFKVFHVLPLDIKVFAENDTLAYYVKNKLAGQVVDMEVSYIDYGTIASKIELSGAVATIQRNGALDLREGVITDFFVNNASNGVGVNPNGFSELGYNFSVELPERFSLFNIFDSNESIGEAVDTKAMFAKFKKEGNVDMKVSRIDYIYHWLDAYFQLPEGKDLVGTNLKGEDNREVVPLLIGPTGVFKSATVKELCKKYNYRMVDFRVAFTSRLDYSGLYNKEVVDGQDVSYACPMEELVECSDGFREYCRRAIENLKTILAKGTVTVKKSSVGSQVAEEEKPITAEHIDKINEMINQYTVHLKTPVLFFDEITRNKNQGVEGVLITLLNQKRFNNMTMYGCKFVAATNLNLDEDVLNDVYDVNREIDNAFSNRFLPLKVKPDDVVDRWFEWANVEKTETRDDGNGNKINVPTGKKNIHPLIVKFLEENPKSVYDESGVVNAYWNPADGTDGTTEAAATPFPNYRTWELISNYIYSVDSTKKFRLDVIRGLIGNNTADSVAVYLSKLGYSEHVVDKDTDDVGSFLGDTLDAGLPALLIGPSSLGKTARVGAYANKLSEASGKPVEVINVDLSSMDAVDIMGMPTKKTLHSFATKESGYVKDELFRQISNDLKDVVDDIRSTTNTGLVNYLTVRGPDGNIMERFKRALADDRFVILFFDECNRVTNTSLMSAMFEAISDHRIFGINFSAQKDKVKIVAACNLGQGNTGAQAIDAALSARFTIFWKKFYDDKDAKSFRNFVKGKVEKGVMDGLLEGYLNTLTDAELLEFMKSVEVREIQDAQPSTRMLAQLSKDIKNMRGSKGASDFVSSAFNGTLLFTPMIRNDIDRFSQVLYDTTVDINDKVAKMRGIVSYIKKNSSRWEAVYLKKSDMFQGERLSAQDALQMLFDMEVEVLSSMNSMNPQEIQDMLIYMQKVTEFLMSMDGAVEDLRKDIFESYAGPEFTRGFLPYFNEHFGTASDAEITIKELDDISLIPEYFNRKAVDFAKLAPDQMISAGINQVDAFWAEWADRLPSENYAEFFNGITALLPSQDNILVMLEQMTIRQDSFMAKAEGAGNGFIRQALKMFPRQITDADIATIKSRITAGGGGTMKKAKLLV